MRVVCGVRALVPDDALDFLEAIEYIPGTLRPPVAWSPSVP